MITDITMSKIKVLFVCLGNICRSPTAEGVFRELSRDCKTLKNIEIDSCGTSGFHDGEPSDPRSVSTAKARGYDLSDIRSRKVTVRDFHEFQYILAMDRSNLESLKTFAINNGVNPNNVFLFMDFSNQLQIKEVPDPYYGGANGFNNVIDLIEIASKGLINELTRT